MTITLAAAFTLLAIAYAARALSATERAPRIDWKACPKGVAPGEYGCATARMPLSYRSLDGRKIELAPDKMPATDQERKIGTLFWNPGAGRLVTYPAAILPGAGRALRHRRLPQPPEPPRF